MKLLAAVLLAWASFLQVGAQNPVNWSTIKPDTLRIDSIATTAVANLQKDKPLEAVALYKLAIAEAKKIKDTYRENDNEYELGNAWKAAGHTDNAFACYTAVLQRTRQQNDVNLFAYAFNALVNYYNEQGKDSAALRLIAHADSLIPVLKGNPINKAMAFGNAGVYFSNKGLKEKGLEFYIKGYEAIKNTNDSQRMYPILMNIASTFSMLQNQAKAYAYAADAQKVIPTGNRRFEALYQLQLGLIDERFKNYDSAEIRLRKAADIFSGLNRTYEQGTALAGLGRVLSMKGNLKQALLVFDEAQNLAEKAGIAMLKARVMYSRGKAYYDAADWPNATLWLQRAYDAARLTNENNVLEDASKYLADAYEKTGNYKQALAMQQVYTGIRDSLTNLSTLFSTAEAEARFQNELLKEQATVKDLTISNQARTMIILALLAAGIAGVGLFINYRTRQRKKLEAAQMRNKIATNLHDEVGSTLSSIGMMTDVLAYRLKEADEKAVETLQKISANARQTMESMDEIIWTINPQQDAFANLETRLKNYAYPLLEAKGIQPDFSFEDGMEQVKLTMEQRQHIYLILKEAINNALKYSEAKYLVVKGGHKGHHLYFRVKDDGKGFELNAVGSQRNGLGNMQKRAAALKGNLELITAAGQGTEVLLMLPVP